MLAEKRTRLEAFLLALAAPAGVAYTIFAALAVLYTAGRPLLVELLERPFGLVAFQTSALLWSVLWVASLLIAWREWERGEPGARRWFIILWLLNIPAAITFLVLRYHRADRVR
jgi:hypothetical protein